MLLNKAINFSANLLFWVCALTSVVAKATDQGSNGKLGLSTWHEAVITTRDPLPWLNLLVQFANWKTLASTEIDPQLLTNWGLAEHAKGREIVLASPDSERGFIRLMHIEGIQQEWIRADDRPWDTGGFFDLNLRIKDLQKNHNKLLGLGWQGDSIPQTIKFGPWEVIEWIARGPDGVRFAFIERIKPELTGWNFEKLSRTFNSTQTLANIDKSLRFFRDGLGMQVKVQHKASSKEPGPNVLGLPHESTATIAREVYVLNGPSSTEGQIELLQFHGASGRDLSEQAKPTNIGLSILRYKVNNMDALTQALKSRGIQFLHEPIRFKLPPYGLVDLTAFRAPEGARFELFEVVKSP